MKTLTLVGVILIVLGLAGFIIKRVTYTSEQSKVDLGPVQITAEQKKTVDIPDIASGAAVVAGAILAIAGASGRRKASA